jgi:hypothetical protein
MVSDNLTPINPLAALVIYFLYFAYEICDFFVDNIKETKGVIENWRKEDNTVRPYNSLNPVVA